MVVVVNYVCFHPTMALDGFEHLRLLKPIEKVYILYDNKRDRYGAASRRNASKLAKTLSFFRPIKIGVNPQSFGNVFSNLFPVLHRETVVERKEVYIDVTDMPPEAVSAVTTLALMFPNVYVYVVPTQQKGDFIPLPGTPRFEEWLEEKDNKRGLEPILVQLPQARLTLFNEGEKSLSEKVVLELYRRGGMASSIKQLIEWCGEDPGSPAVKNRFSRLVNDMARKGLLYKEYSGRERPIFLTEFGKMYAKALAGLSIAARRAEEHEEYEVVDRLAF